MPVCLLRPPLPTKHEPLSDRMVAGTPNLPTACCMGDPRRMEIYEAWAVGRLWELLRSCRAAHVILGPGADLGVVEA